MATAAPRNHEIAPPPPALEVNFDIFKKGKNTFFLPEELIVPNPFFFPTLKNHGANIGRRYQVPIFCCNQLIRFCSRLSFFFGGGKDGGDGLDRRPHSQTHDS